LWPSSFSPNTSLAKEVKQSDQKSSLARFVFVIGRVGSRLSSDLAFCYIQFRFRTRCLLDFPVNGRSFLSVRFHSVLQFSGATSKSSIERRPHQHPCQELLSLSERVVSPENSARSQTNSETRSLRPGPILRLLGNLIWRYELEASD